MKQRVGKAVLVLAVAAALVVGLVIVFESGGAGTETTQAEEVILCRVQHDCDSDGCHDTQEMGSDETHGGLRNVRSPWDWYDVASAGGTPEPDAVIDLPNDILGVMNHQGSAPGPPYDVHYDRGPSEGPNGWNMTEPDGVIDLPNDILGVILQFSHNCQHVD